MADGKHEDTTKPWWARYAEQLGARAKKAWSAGVTGATLAIGGISVAGFWADGRIDTSKVAAAAGTIVVGFVAGFLAAFLPRNAIVPTSQEPQPATVKPSNVDYRLQQGQGGDA